MLMSQGDMEGPLYNYKEKGNTVELIGEEVIKDSPTYHLKITTSEGEIKKSGLFNSKINNCEIGDDVLLENVNLVKNYRIMDHVIIENVNSISVNGSSSFVNGFEIEVLNEGGGRELVMFDQLSAQLAYILES